MICFAQGRNPFASSKADTSFPMMNTRRSA